MFQRTAILLIVASIATSCGSPDGGRIGPSPTAELAPADAATPGAPDPTPDVVDGSATHYLEFRARIGSMPYGHTYMVYGRLDETGEPVDESIVGLLPSAGFAGLLLGTVVDVPGTIGSSELDDVMPVLNVYRRPLTEAQYDRLLAAIGRVRQNVPDWGLFGYNCNWFAGELASAVGMNVPRDTSVMPAFYVETLRTANEDPGSSDDAERVAAGSPVED